MPSSTCIPKGILQWKNNTKSPSQVQREQVTKEIHCIFLESRCLYRSPKVKSILRRKGRRISQKTVARIMKEPDLQSRIVKKYKATTNSKHSDPIHAHVLEPQFKVENPNQVWVADITYVSTKEGSVLHHSGRGSQYASNDYKNQLQQHGMNCSMSRKGNCYDNACIESFHGVLKQELIYQQQYVKRVQAQQDIWDTLRFSIILKEFIQRMTIYRLYKKEGTYELEVV